MYLIKRFKIYEVKLIDIQKGIEKFTVNVGEQHASDNN